MSGNNSLPDKDNGVDLPSHYALRVALQTMKERCVSLQQRLSSIEDENAILRNQTPNDTTDGGININILRGCQSEAELLRKRVDELTSQKLQLTEHIAMVATENRQLWSRLSQLAKVKQIKHKNRPTDNQPYTSSSSSGQNLIRSRTFTQHSPNPLLRQKCVVTLEDDKSLNDLSLEEISLKNFNKYNDGKLIENGKGDYDVLNVSSNILEFGYLNDDSTDGDIGVEAKKCIDNMTEMKKELSNQQSDLSELLSALRKKGCQQNQECLECKKRTNKPETADKIIEAKEDLICSMKPTTSSFNNYLSPQKSRGDEELSIPFGFLEEKRRADYMDKMCPMCGKVFDSSVLFDKFEEHVETHFIDEDLDPNLLEKTFEMVSHVVGNF